MRINVNRKHETFHPSIITMRSLATGICDPNTSVAIFNCLNKYTGVELYLRIKFHCKKENPYSIPKYELDINLLPYCKFTEDDIINTMNMPSLDLSPSIFRSEYYVNNEDKLYKSVALNFEKLAERINKEEGGICCRPFCRFLREFFFRLKGMSLNEN